MNFLNVATAVADTASMPEFSQVASTDAGLSYWKLALSGGWLMIPLVLLSVLSIYIFCERWVVLKRASKEDTNFMNKIKDYICDGQIDAALSLCRNSRTPYASMIEKGISRLGRPMQDIQVAIENVGNLEVAKLEKGLPVLATTAAGAPMIGFLGTVTGMVRAFYTLASAGSDGDITLLSGGIYEALVTTVAGLIVGIIAMFGYNILVARVTAIINMMESKSMEFMDLLNKPMK